LVSEPRLYQSNPVRGQTVAVGFSGLNRIYSIVKKIIEKRLDYVELRVSFQMDKGHWGIKNI
jgi:hypothetical protein